MTQNLEIIDDATFERVVLGAEQPYLLDFSATWCAPCRALEPILEQLVQDYKGQVRIGTINIDEAPEVAARFGVRGAPTLIVFEQGREKARKLGLTNRRALLELLGLPAQPAHSSAPVSFTPRSARASADDRG